MSQNMLTTGQFKKKEFFAMTGLTERQVNHYGNMLKKAGVFVGEKVYKNKGKTDIKCIGTEKTIVADWGWLQESCEEN